MQRLTLGVCFLLTAWQALAQAHDHGQAGAPSRAAPAAPPAVREWTRSPLLLAEKSERGERTSAVLRAANIAATELKVYAPGGPPDRRSVSYLVERDRAKIESVTPQIGNYHWVVAREESGDEVRVASTAWYFGNPGPSPKDLLKRPKHELEIVPDPLPREHSSYRESEKWRFLVRFNGQPLPNQPLVLETEFGSRSTFLTDANGIATVLFPRDFRPAAGGHGPRRAKFVLATETTTEGRHYLTAFNHAYGQDGDRDKSLGWGAAFGLAGMLAATPLLRRKKGTPENA